jgi:hypothetical protein
VISPTVYSSGWQGMGTPSSWQAAGQHHMYNYTNTWAGVGMSHSSKSWILASAHALNTTPLIALGEVMIGSFVRAGGAGGAGGAVGAQKGAGEQ